MKARFVDYTLDFRFEAGTSRGVMHDRISWFLILKYDGIQGVGEIGPLPGLSVDDIPEMEGFLDSLVETVNNESFRPDQVLQELADVTRPWPAVAFGLETALKDLQTGGQRVLYPGRFTSGDYAIPINGLIWMGSKDFMIRQLEEKISQGFSCIKVKVGALDFESEEDMLQLIRSRHGDRIELRLDANGAFHPDEAESKLERLSRYGIHSIEQPIKPGQPETMQKIIRNSPIPIALDEELIGVQDEAAREQLVDFLNPDYLILKPTLLGGLAATSDWIELAESHGAGWWITSALESNLGLNAIAQFSAGYNPKLPQGLGTGQLYHNNFISPLEISGNSLTFQKSRNWDLSAFGI